MTHCMVAMVRPSRKTGLPQPALLPIWEPPSTKTMNTHLHLLEAMTNFYRASSLPLARERLLELIHIQSTTVVRKEVGTCTDKYRRDWTPMLDEDHTQVAYGHCLENIWLLIDACDAAGISPSPLRNFFRRLFNYVLKYGFDEKKRRFLLQRQHI